MKHVFLQRLLTAGVLSVAASQAATAADYSWAGTFSNDDDFQFISFVADGINPVTLETVSYDGGLLTDGVTPVVAGGFDPFLTLLQPSGLIIYENDDKVLGVNFEAFYQGVLAAGTYWLAITQTGNLVNGVSGTYYTIADGFTETGHPSYTADVNGCTVGTTFCDYTATNRTGNWTINIKDVVSSTGPAAFVPSSEPPTIPTVSVAEPSTLAMLGLGLAGLLGNRRRRV